MAAPSFLYARGGLMANKRVNPGDSFFLPRSSSFHGSRSMVSFEDRGNGSMGQLFDQEDNGYDEHDEYFQQPEKKRRLTADQVRCLEKSFDLDNKLEPDRKIQLAKDLGLQPRQVAIWFQNRRARWKNKQLEKEYDDLQESYNKLKANYENLVKDKEILKSEVDELSHKLLLQEKGIEDSSSLFEPQLCQQTLDRDVSKAMNKEYAEEANLTMKIDLFHNGVQTSLLEHGDSSYVFESEESLDQENNFHKMFLPSVDDNSSANMENHDYAELHLVDSYYRDDQAFGFWSY